MKFYTILVILLMLTSLKSFAQFSDLARIDYTIIPSGDSSIEYNRLRVLFNYPIKLKKESTYLFLGVDYSNINLTIDEDISINKDELDGFQLLDFNIGYTTPLKNDWRLGARLTPGFSSNLTAKELGIKDIVISADLVFIKDKTNDDAQLKPWRLILGVSYSGNRGFPYPLPFISYYKKIHHRWSYNLGIPKTNLQYHFSETHSLKLYTEIDGFTSNLQQGVLIDNKEAESINMSLIIGGIQYEYHITNHIQFYAKASYIINHNVNLRDGKRKNIIDLDDSNTSYFRTGIRLKI